MKKFIFASFLFLFAFNAQAAEVQSVGGWGSDEKTAYEVMVKNCQKFAASKNLPKSNVDVFNLKTELSLKQNGFNMEQVPVHYIGGLCIASE